MCKDSCLNYSYLFFSSTSIHILSILLSFLTPSLLFSLSFFFSFLFFFFFFRPLVHQRSPCYDLKRIKSPSLMSLVHHWSSNDLHFTSESTFSPSLIWIGRLLQLSPHKNRTCDFHRIRLKQLFRVFFFFSPAHLYMGFFLFGLHPTRSIVRN